MNEMVATIIIVSIAYAWLLKETNFLKIHLLIGIAMAVQSKTDAPMVKWQCLAWAGSDHTLKVIVEWLESPEVLQQQGDSAYLGLHKIHLRALKELVK